MNIKLSQIIDFPLFYQQIKDQKMPIQTIYKLSQLKRELDFHINFYKENLSRIVFKYSARDESGAPIEPEDGIGFLIQKQNEKECLKEIQELQNLEITVPDVVFSFSEFEELKISLEAWEIISIFTKN